MNLRAAVSSELFRAVRSGPSLFWAYGLVPAMLLLMAAPSQLRLDDVAAAPLRFEALVRAVGAAGNPFVHLFYAIGASTLFAGDYGWETWRLILPRNSRANIILAKFATYGLFILASLAASLMAFVMPSAVILLFTGGLGAWVFDAGLVMHLLVAALASLLEALVIGGAVAVVAVITRSAVAAITCPFLGSLGLTLLLDYLSPPLTSELLLALPPYAGDVVRFWAEGSDANAVTGEMVGLALASLASAAAGLIAATTILFDQQDLANE